MKHLASVAVFLGLAARRDGREVRAGESLYEDLLAEALRDLDPAIESLVLVPDGVLNRLPFAALRDPRTGRLTYCNGGHPPPQILNREQGGAHEALFRTGIPLGISDDAMWERAVIQIPAGGLAEFKIPSWPSHHYNCS